METKYLKFYISKLIIARRLDELYDISTRLPVQFKQLLEILITFERYFDSTNIEDNNKLGVCITKLNSISEVVDPDVLYACNYIVQFLKKNNDNSPTTHLEIARNIYLGINDTPKNTDDDIPILKKDIVNPMLKIKDEVIFVTGTDDRTIYKIVQIDNNNVKFRSFADVININLNDDEEVEKYSFRFYGENKIYHLHDIIIENGLKKVTIRTCVKCKKIIR